MPTILTSEFLNPYFQTLAKRHIAYTETVEIAADLRVHADGENGGHLISERRPSESEEIKKYREKIFVAITEPIVSKVITSLSKIRRSSDWSIKYDPQEIPQAVIPEETLEEYCEKRFPQFGSVTKWIFDVLLKSYLVDPNAIVLTLTDDPTQDKSVYPKPYSIIFESARVYDYVDEKYAILYSTDKCEYTLEGGRKIYDGDVYYTCDTEVIQRWVQTDAKHTISLEWERPHKLGRMPAFKTKGIFSRLKDKIYIYKSRINAMVPHLKEAVREYSDLQAEVVQHIHSTMWVYETQKCDTCKGTGHLIKKGNNITCDVCKGKGKIPVSPYGALKVELPKIGEPAIPGGVPMGYVQKQVDIVKIQDERIDKHKYQALAAINMEFLAEVPLAQSGVAKNVDRDELNTFVDAVAEDIVAHMDRLYADYNDMRYMVVVPDKKKRQAMLPSIPVPQNYDLLSSDYLLAELETAKKALLNPVTITALEIEFANKKFNNNPEVRDELKAVLLLDPLPGVSDDAKIIRLQNDGISQKDYVISCNIYPFVKRAMEEGDEKFLSLDLPEQQKVIEKYADEKIKENSAKAAVLDPNPSAPAPAPTV